MQFTGTFRAPRINLQSFIRELSEILSAKIAQAAFEWLQATAEDIPVWSGASRATFLHLARSIDYHLDISPSANAPDRINIGLRNGDGGVFSKPEDGRFHFRYSTTLEHLIYNESNNANVTPDPGLFFRLLNPGPYKFQEKGKAAFLRVASTAHLPNPFNHLRIKQIKVG